MPYTYICISLSLSLSLSLSGTSASCQHGAFSHFFRFFSTFGPMHQNVVTLGGFCVCFSKSVRKHHFRNVCWGGGHSKATNFEIMQELCLANLSPQPTVGYKVRCLVPPLSRVLLVTCMFHILLQIDVDAGCQKFMLRSLAWVLFTIPKLGCKGSGLCSGQNLVFLVGAGKLRCPACTGFLGLLGRTPSHTHPLCTPRTHPFAHQRFLGCIGRSNSTLREFVCGHGTCLLTNRGRKQHRHRPKWTKISNMSSVEHANLGVPNSPFQWLSEYTPHTPPPSFWDTQQAQMRQQRRQPLKMLRVGMKLRVPEREREREISIKGVHTPVLYMKSQNKRL